MPLGPGALDANAIYQYGESDSAGPLFSDFLNLLGASVSAKFTAAALPFVAASAAARDTHWGTPANAAARRALQDRGALTVRTDKGNIEQYFANFTDGGANPGGRTVQGWYIVLGPDTPASLALAANWAVYSGSYTAPSWYYSGHRVHLKGSRLIRTGATLVVAGGGTYALTAGAVASAQRPAEPITAPGILGVNGTIATCMVQLTSAGILQMISLAAGTIQTTGGDGNHVTIPDMSWRLQL
jgi:hypothetical protein